MISEDMRDARQEAERDLDAEATEVHCPACGQHDCEPTRDFGAAADFQCECGWRFRADRSGRVLREFGYAA